MRAIKIASLIALGTFPCLCKGAVKVCVETADQRTVNVTITGGKSIVSNVSGKCQYLNYKDDAVLVSAPGYVTQKVSVRDGGEFRMTLVRSNNRVAAFKSSLSTRRASIRLVYGSKSADAAAIIENEVEKAGLKVELAQTSKPMGGDYSIQSPPDVGEEGKLVADAAQHALLKIPGYELVSLEIKQVPGNATIVIELGPPLKLLPKNAIVSGDRFTCVLYQGKVTCMGSDSIPPQYRIYGSASEEVPFSSPVSAIAAGSTFACAITIEGRLYCWGRLGTDWNDIQPIPIEMFPKRRFTDLAAAFQHWCAIEYPSAHIVCWGSNSEGELGHAPLSKEERLTELTDVVVPDNQRFRSVSAGSGETCGITDLDDAYCWGTFEKNSSAKEPSPFLPGQKVEQISLNTCGYGSCTILTTGSVACLNTEDSDIPKVVSQPAFDQAAFCGYHVIALDKQGQPWHWGYNDRLPEFHYPTAEHLEGGRFVAVGHDAILIGNDPLALSADGKLVTWSSGTCAKGCTRTDVH